MKGLVGFFAILLTLLAGGLAAGDVLDAGADRLVSTQNGDGGWDWPLSDHDGQVSNAPNVFAPTAMGLLEAYERTQDPNHLAALNKAGKYLLRKTPKQITPEDGYLAVALDRVLGVTVHTEFVKKYFYDALASGTYDYFGNRMALLDTATYVYMVRASRNQQGLANLAAADLGMGLYAASLIGADTSAWVAGVKAEIEQMDGDLPFDVFGLAGAVLGLAAAGQDCDPASGEHAAASSLADLARILASYQLASGGFTWNSRNKEEEVGNETIQETAIAILALGRFDPNSYGDCINNAAAYVERVQLPSGGWEDFITGGEYNEVTGEALWAVGQALRPKQEQE